MPQPTHKSKKSPDWGLESMSIKPPSTWGCIVHTWCTVLGWILKTCKKWKFLLNHTLSIWLQMEFTSDIFSNISLRWLFSNYFKKTNKIYIYITISLREKIYIVSFVAFRIFVCLKNVFFDLHQEKVLQYTEGKMYYSEKTHCYVILAMFCEKILKWWQLYIS